MSLHDDLKKKLSPENMQTLEDILGDDFEWDLVPRSRLNKVIKQRNDLKKQVNTPNLDTSSKDDDDDDNGGDGNNSGSATYSEKEVQKLLQAERDKASKAANDAEIKFATLSKLQTEKALDAELVFGLLDSSKLSFNDKHELQGLEEAGLKSIKEGKPFLFGEADDVPPGTGKQGAGGNNGKKGDAVDAAIANVFAGYNFTDTSSQE